MDRKLIRPFAAAATLVVAAALPVAAQAREAHLDPGFADGAGFVTTTIPDRTSVAYAAAVLRNGKVAIAGQASDEQGNGQIVVARFKRDGTPDPSFGANGIFTSEFPTADGPFLATSIEQEPSTRKLVVGGGYGQDSMLALRLTAGGRLDGTFGADGVGRTIVPSGGIAQSLAIQPNGRILLGGSNANDNGRPMVLARLRQGGGLDPSFGDAGQVQSLFWNPGLAASAGVASIVPTPDGGLVAFGHLDYIGSDGHGSAGIFRLDPSGQPVQRFGTGGHAEIDFELSTGVPAFWFPCAMTVDGSGRITVTGDGTGSGQNDGALLTTRLTLAGDPDPSFGRGGDGKVATQGLPDGAFPTCGATRTANGGLLTGVGTTLVQLTSRGARRAAFAPGGMLEIADPANLGINAVERWDARRVVAAGSAGESLYLSRYVVPKPR